MAYTLIASAKETSGGGGPTDAIDTTGADLLVVVVTGSIEPVPNGGSGLNDSKSNTFTGLTYRNASACEHKMFYCVNPTVGTNHTFEQTGDAFCGICVAAFSGIAASPFDQEGGATPANATSAAPGSLTPSQDNCLVVAGIGHGAAEAFTSIDDGFTLLVNKAGVGGVVYSCGLAYKIQTTAAAVNPTWSWTTSAGSALSIASFKALTGGGGSTDAGGMLLSSRRNRLTIP